MPDKIIDQIPLQRLWAHWNHMVFLWLIDLFLTIGDLHERSYDKLIKNLCLRNMNIDLTC